MLAIWSDGTSTRSASVKVAQAALVQPGYESLVEIARPQVNRHEFGRRGVLSFEHGLLFAHVAVDHAHDRFDSKPATERQCGIRAHVAEGQQYLGASAIDRAGQLTIEPLCSSLGERAVETREPFLQVGLRAEATGRMTGLSGRRLMESPGRAGLASVSRAGENRAGASLRESEAR